MATNAIKINTKSDSNKNVYINYDTTNSTFNYNFAVNGTSYFSSMPTFNEVLQVSQGGTGAASLDTAGIVTKTGDQIITGAKTFSGNIIVTNTTNNGTSLIFNFTNTPSANVEYGRIFLRNANYGGAFTFRQYSGTSTARTNYREDYALPEPDSGLTTNKPYDILTSKNLVTVEQGGTGADNASDARTNLGIGTIGTLNSLSASHIPTSLRGTNFTNGTNYALISFGFIELYHDTPYINFHFGNSTADYTSRIIENASGRLNIVASNGVQFNGGALPVANGGTGATSLDAAGIVTKTGSQTISGDKVFSAATRFSANTFIRNNARYGTLRFGSTAATAYGDNAYGPASIRFDFGSTTAVTNSRMAIRQHSATASSGDTTFTAYYEDYFLPSTDVARTSNSVYYILTTKSMTLSDANASTVRSYLKLGTSATYDASTAATGNTVALRNSNGDITGRYLTGTWLQTTAATAQSAPTKIATLGADNFIYYATPANVVKAAGINTPTLITSGGAVTIAANSSATISVTTANYQFYIFKFNCNSCVTTIFATVSELSTTAQKYMIDDGTSSAAPITITRATNGFTITRDGSTSCMVTLRAWN